MGLIRSWRYWRPTPTGAGKHRDVVAHPGAELSELEVQAVLAVRCHTRWCGGTAPPWCGASAPKPTAVCGQPWASPSRGPVPAVIYQARLLSIPPLPLRVRVSRHGGAVDVRDLQQRAGTTASPSSHTEPLSTGLTAHWEPGGRRAQFANASPRPSVSRRWRCRRVLVWRRRDGHAPVGGVIRPGGTPGSSPGSEPFAGDAAIYPCLGPDSHVASGAARGPS